MNDGEYKLQYEIVLIKWGHIYPQVVESFSEYEQAREGLEGYVDIAEDGDLYMITVEEVYGD